MVEALFCSCLRHPGLLVLAICFDTMVDNLIAIVFNVMLVSLCLLKSEASLKEKPQCELNVAFDSKVTRSCGKIIDIIKLQDTL